MPARLAKTWRAELLANMMTSFLAGPGPEDMESHRVLFCSVPKSRGLWRWRIGAQRSRFCCV
jgi:hypothetical protein